MNVTAVVLAAGNSSRMGSQKLLLEIDGRSLLQRAIAAVAAYPTVVVVSPEIAPSAEAAGATHIIINGDPNRGMTHSARLADAAISDLTSGLLVLPADLPLLEPRHVELVVKAASRARASIARPMRRGVPGHPVFFDAAARQMIRTLPDGDTLRHIFQKMAGVCCDIEIDDPACFIDIDTPEDFARAVQANRQATP